MNKGTISSPVFFSALGKTQNIKIIIRLLEIEAISLVVVQ